MAQSEQPTAEVKLVYEPSFLCIHCDCVFTAQETLEHISVCTPRVLCSTCAQHFPDARALTTHCDAVGHGERSVQVSSVSRTSCECCHHPLASYPQDGDHNALAIAAVDAHDQVNSPASDSSTNSPSSPLSSGSFELVAVSSVNSFEWSEVSLSQLDSPNASLSDNEDFASVIADSPRPESPQGSSLADGHSTSTSAEAVNNAYISEATIAKNICQNISTGVFSCDGGTQENPSLVSSASQDRTSTFIELPPAEPSPSKLSTPKNEGNMSVPALPPMTCDLALNNQSQLSISEASQTTTYEHHNPGHSLGSQDSSETPGPRESSIAAETHAELDDNSKSSNEDIAPDLGQPSAPPGSIESHKQATVSASCAAHTSVGESPNDAILNDVTSVEPTSQKMDAGTCIICNLDFARKMWFETHCRFGAETHPFCGTCGILFSTISALGAHFEQTGCQRADCSDCHAIFPSADRRIRHQQNTKHGRNAPNYYRTSLPAITSEHCCHTCKVSFATCSQLVAHYIQVECCTRCMDCEITFTSSIALLSHQRGEKHRRRAAQHRCTDSQKLSSSSKSSVLAFENQGEYSRLMGPACCAECNLWFINDFALTSHISTAKAHAIFSPASRSEKRKTNKADPSYCADCQRPFYNAEDLRLHKMTKKHKIQANKLSKERNRLPIEQHSKCPLCSKTFSFTSSIAHHLESGYHGLNRHHITAAVHSMGIVPTVSLSHRITSGGIPSAKPLIKYSATENAWNGTAYECYLCHRQFLTLAGLNAHLSSAAHDEKEFVCTNSKCKREFTLISALIQHIESGTCGVAPFAEVKKYADALEAQFSRMLIM